MRFELLCLLKYLDFNREGIIRLSDGELLRTQILPITEKLLNFSLFHFNIIISAVFISSIILYLRSFF